MCWPAYPSFTRLVWSEHGPALVLPNGFHDNDDVLNERKLKKLVHVIHNEQIKFTAPTENHRSSAH